LGSGAQASRNAQALSRRMHLRASKRRLQTPRSVILWSLCERTNVGLGLKCVGRRPALEFLHFHRRLNCGARTLAQYHLKSGQALTGSRGRDGRKGRLACRFNERRQAEPPVLPYGCSACEKLKWNCALLRAASRRLSTPSGHAHFMRVGRAEARLQGRSPAPQFMHEERRDSSAGLRLWRQSRS
jgi:hypothetical protein